VAANNGCRYFYQQKVGVYMHSIVKSRPANRAMKKMNKWPYLFILPFFIAYFVFQLFPIMYSFYISLTDWDGISQMRFIGFNNYVKLFTTDPFFLKSIGNTLVIIACYIPLGLIMGLLVAVVLFDETFKGRRFFQAANFLPYITTPVAVGILFNILFDWQTGIINKLLINAGLIGEGIDWLGGHWFYTRFVIILVLIWQNFGYYMTLYLAGMSGISHDIYEAAIVDGSSKINTFFRITVPLLRPVTLFLVVTSIIGGLQLFDQPMLLLGGTTAGMQGIAGGPNRTALTAMWNFYDTAFGTSMRYGYGAAISYGLFMFIGVFSFIGFKITNRGGKAS
jgi:cellobiose transport system permease protein